MKEALNKAATEKSKIERKIMANCELIILKALSAYLGRTATFADYYDCNITFDVSGNDISYKGARLGKLAMSHVGDTMAISFDKDPKTVFANPIN